MRIMYIMLNDVSTYANSSLVCSPIPLRFQNTALFVGVIKHNRYLP